MTTLSNLMTVSADVGSTTYYYEACCEYESPACVSLLCFVILNKVYLDVKDVCFLV